MLKVSADYFLPVALQRLTAGTDDEIKETVELLLLYRQTYLVPRSTRLAISARLTPLLKHSDVTIRYWSARALGEYGCPEVLPFLREAFASESNSSVRGWLQGAVAHLSNVQIDQLRLDLQSPYPETRSIAAQTLFFNPAAEARSLIDLSMNEDNAAVLSWKLLALPGPLHMRSRSALIYPSSEHVFEGSNSPKKKDQIDILQSLIQSGDDQISEYSIWNAALGRMSELAFIIRDMAMPGGHANPRVREWAYKFLGFVPNRNDLSLLESVLDVENDPKVRQGVVFAIGRIGGSEALEYLVEVLRHDADDDVKRWAARAMLGNRISWLDAESKLIDVVERSDSEVVIREVLGVLEKKNSTSLLERLPLVEERAKSQGFALVSLLLSLASDRMDVAAKSKLTNMLSRRISPVEVTAVAYAMAEDYGMASRIIAVSSALSAELDSYRHGLNLLFQAAALSERDLTLCKRILHDALDLLRRVRQQLSITDQDGLVVGQKLNPLFAFSQFYEEVALSYGDIIEGIESRLQGNFDGAIGRFERAVLVYKLHEFDQAISATERNLCSAIKLWLFFQVELTRYARETELDTPLLLSASLSLLRTAIFRAKDALRFSLAERLDGILLEVAEILAGGKRELIFERKARVNRAVLSIPVALDAPFSAPSAVKVSIIDATGLLEGVRLSCRIIVDGLLLQDVREPFEVELVFYFSYGTAVRKIFSSTEMGGNVSGATVFDRSLVIEEEESAGPLDKVTLQPLLRVAGLELVCGNLESVEVERESYQSGVLTVAELRRTILQRFDQEELRTLCQDLGVNYDDLRGEGRAGKTRELVALLKRQNRLHELQATLRVAEGGEHA